MQHIAFEGRCFVLSSVQYLERKDCPEDYADTAPVLIRGSVIVNPQGVVLGGPHFCSETTLLADLDRKRKLRNGNSISMSPGITRVRTLSASR